MTRLHDERRRAIGAMLHADRLLREGGPTFVNLARMAWARARLRIVSTLFRDYEVQP